MMLKEDKKDDCVYAVAARYETEEALMTAVQALKGRGYQDLEVYSPFPVEGMAKILNFKERCVPWMVFAGGVFGAVGGFLMQYAANVWFWPLNIGGRPFNSWPAFIPITFELTILSAAAAGFVTFLARCRLPTIYHPAFDIPGFERATLDSFYLCILSTGRKFDIPAANDALAATNPKDIHCVRSDV